MVSKSSAELLPWELQWENLKAARPFWGRWGTAEVSVACHRGPESGWSLASLLFMSNPVAAEKLLHAASGSPCSLAHDRPQRGAPLYSEVSPSEGTCAEE